MPMRKSPGINHVRTCRRPILTIPVYAGRSTVSPVARVKLSMATNSRRRRRNRRRGTAIALVKPVSISSSSGPVFPRILSVAEFGRTFRPQRFVRGEGSRACKGDASAGSSPRALPGRAGRRPSRTLPADCPFLHEIRLYYVTDSKDAVLQASADDRAVFMDPPGEAHRLWRRRPPQCQWAVRYPMRTI